MPVIKSAIKKLRQDKKKEKINDVLRKALKDTLKNISNETSAKKVSQAVSVIDKAAKIGIIHKNKASRLKSRIAKPVKTTAPQTKKTKKKIVKKKITKKK